MQLKNDIQMMITDYKEMCTEREELLYSLQDVSDKNSQCGQATIPYDT